MKKKMVLFVMASVVVFAVLFLLNDKTHRVEIFKSSKPEVKYEKSNIVNLPMLKVKTLNPINSTDKDTYYISKLIFESLYVLDDHLVARPCLAQSQFLNKATRELTITLKTDAYFSDGEPLTAQDVKFSIDSYRNTPKTIYANYVSQIKEVKLDRDDAYTFTIKYKELKDISLENLVFPIVSKKQYIQVAKSSKLWEEGIAPIGSGPYMVSKYNDISEMILEPNDSYKKERPKNSLHFSVLVSNEDIIPLLDVSTLSMAISEDMARKTAVSDKNIRLKNFIAPEAEIVGFNLKSKFMQNKSMRKAIAYLIDAKTINDDIYYKNGILNDNIYFPNYMGVKNEGDSYKFNKSKAKKIISENKFVDLNGDGILDINRREQVKLKILVNKKHSEKVLIAEKLSEELKSVGILTSMIQADDDIDFNAKLLEQQYDFFIATYKFNEQYDLRYMLHSKYANISGYQNPKLDVLLDKFKLEIDEESKTATFKKIKGIIDEDLPYYCILYKTYGVMLADSIRGFDSENGDDSSIIFNNYYAGAYDWYCEYPKQEKDEKK